jgi:hypothetical protein
MRSTERYATVTENFKKKRKKRSKGRGVQNLEILVLGSGRFSFVEDILPLALRPTPPRFKKGKEKKNGH